MQEVIINLTVEQCIGIALGSLTTIVRKYSPECELPFKCYVYCDSYGGVMGELVCTKIVSRKDSDGKTLYDWHVGNLKIYDSPRELRTYFQEETIA